MSDDKNNKPQEEVEEGLPAWMATFADMMTLLLCFFVLLLSFAKQDIAKFESLTGSIRDAFGVQIKRPYATKAAFSPTDKESKGEEQKSQDVQEIAREMMTIIEENKFLRRSATVATEREGVLIRMESAYLFGPGSAKLNRSAERALAEVAKLLKDNPLNCLIQGHTADDKEPGIVSGDNWDLSSERALAAMRVLINTYEIPDRRLTAVGYAGTRPLVPNDSYEDRAKNRRLEFYFYRPEKSPW
jgi:chemotaxis protein MotB